MDQVSPDLTRYKHTHGLNQLTPVLQSTAHSPMANTAVIDYTLEEVNVDYKMSGLKSSFFNSAGSRPLDKEGWAVIQAL